MKKDDLLENVKNALSYDYSDEKIETTINNKIKAARTFLKEAGVTVDEKNNDLFLEAIITFVQDNMEIEGSKKMASPVFLSYVVQLRNTEPSEAQDDNED